MRSVFLFRFVVLALWSAAACGDDTKVTRPLRWPSEDGLFPGPCTYQFDKVADGKIDYRSRYAYSSDGYELSREDDDDANGLYNRRIEYSYADDGTLQREEWDNNRDGLLDVRVDWVWDGKKRTYTGATDILGNPGDHRTVDTYDAALRLKTVELDTNLDGRVDSRTTHFYDKHGYETRFEEDTDANGVADQITTYKLDARGRSSQAETVDAAGVVVSHDVYTRDKAGNVTRRERDDGVDGVIDWRETYTYECW